MSDRQPHSQRSRRAAYGAGLIEVPAFYGAMFIAIAISLAGYVRWDERHHA